MDFYRTKSKLHISPWDEQKLIVLELTPALDNAPKGKPVAGSTIYNKDAKCNISFSPEESFKAAFHIMQLNQGVDFKYEKMADTSKIAGKTDGEVKSLTIDKGQKGGIAIFLKSGSRSVNIILSNAEAYALQKYFEVYASKYI